MPTTPFITVVALIAWLPITWFLFKKYRPERAAWMSFLGAIMFLPQGAEFDFPLVPPIGKEQIGALCALWGLFMRRGRLLARSRPFRGIEGLGLVMVLGAVGTALTNPEPLVYGGWKKIHLPGMTFKDAISEGIRDVFNVIVPFYVARVAYRSRRDLRELFVVFAGAGIVYAFFELVELRFSPVWHIWIYGYGQIDDFLQTMRWGGWRPQVFMAHGIAVGLFTMAAALSAALLSRARVKVGRFRAAPVTAFLAVMTVACKSTGAIIYGAVLLPLVLRTRPRTQMRVAVFFAVLVLTYPFSRAMGWFPTQALLDGAAKIAVERSESLGTRFQNEDMISEKTRERIVFGWGGYGRSHTFNEEAKDITITDGHWIIIFGRRGLAGFVPTFLLLLYPVFVARKALPRLRDPKDRALLAGLSLITAVYVLDLVPNGLFSNVPFFLSGALWGLSVHVPLEKEVTRPMRRPPPPAGPPPPQSFAANRQPAATAPAR